MITEDAKTFFASVEAVKRNQYPLRARIAVVSKPDNHGGLVLASSPLVIQANVVRNGNYYRDLQFKVSGYVENQVCLYFLKEGAIN
ncbi:hypothetical protein [Lentibacillus daqui]|uniref:hypothetical protein n=1 Tax=Lentibacillus daqui TaxID=2911514 RepID=UPI0022B1196F|nr:hypothetical protein [Lentibacillus daqui]